MASVDMTRSSTFWIVAVPTSTSSRAVISGLSDLCSTSTSGSSCEALLSVNEFRIPSLAVGTLDQLISLSDTTLKLDERVEATVRKVSKQYQDSINEDKAQNSDTHTTMTSNRHSHTMNSALLVDNESAYNYVRSFSWDKARFPVKSPLSSLSSIICNLCDDYAQDLRKHQGRYQEVKTTLSAMQRKQTGSLILRPLHGIVKKEHIVSGEYLTTLIVVVPVAKQKDFLSSYETMEDEISDNDDDIIASSSSSSSSPSLSKHNTICRIVVPRSALEIFRDADFILYRIVVVNNRRVTQLKKIARTHRYTCRDFKYDALEHENSIKARLKLEQERDFLWRNLVKWCSATYSDMFKAWLHLKAIRTFVESVLRFGLPVSFTSAVLEVKSSHESKLRVALANLYSDLSGAKMASVKDDVDYSGVGADFYPYVFQQLHIVN